MATKKKKNLEPGKIDLGNQLVISSIKKIHKMLIESFEKGEDVSLYSSQIESIDLTGMQLLLWTQKHCEKTKTKLTMDIHYSKAVKEIIEKTGFSALIN
jgi:hypothetical protein